MGVVLHAAGAGVGELLLQDARQADRDHPDPRRLDERQLVRERDRRRRLGLELEGRKNFGFLADELAPLTATLNAAYIQSTVTLPDDPVLPPNTPSVPLTTTTHELQGQSPYVINAALEYSTPDFGTARFLYVTSGERIVALGYFPLANIIEKPRNQLDFVWFKRLESSTGR